METVSTQRAALPRSAERATLSREFSSPAPTMVKPLGWRAEETTKLRLSPITLKILIGLADMSVVLIALWAAARLAALTGSNATTEQMAETRKVAFVSLPLWLLAFIRFRLYQARFLGRRSQELRRRDPVRLHPGRGEHALQQDPDARRGQARALQRGTADRGDDRDGQGGSWD